MAGVPTLVSEPCPRFEFTVVDLDPLRAAVRAVGDLDLAARDALTEILDQQDDAHRHIVHLDLSQVTFMDSSCLGALVAAHHRLLARQGLLVLTGVDNCVARVLKLTGLDNLLFIVPAGQDWFGSALTARVPERPTGRHVARPQRIPHTSGDLLPTTTARKAAS